MQDIYKSLEIFLLWEYYEIWHSFSKTETKTTTAMTRKGTQNPDSSPVATHRHPSGAYSVISDGVKKDAVVIAHPHLFNGEVDLDALLQEHIGCKAKDAYSQPDVGTDGTRYSFSSESALLNHEVGSMSESQV